MNIKKVNASAGLYGSPAREMIRGKILSDMAIDGGWGEERRSQHKALIIPFQSNTWLIFVLLIKVI